jgi:hypothetical protein
MRKGIEALADRMQVLATIYIAVGIISVVIVIIRNV